MLRRKRAALSASVNAALFLAGGLLVAGAVGSTWRAGAGSPVSPEGTATRDQQQAPGPQPNPKSGRIRTLADVDPELQKVLKMAPAPTHDEPTPWGNFIINPVINGEGVLNPQSMPIPAFQGDAARRMQSAGPSSPSAVAAATAHFIDVPVEFRKGMAAAGAAGASEGSSFWTKVFYASGDGTERYMSVGIEAYTPTDLVPFDEFPDTAIRDFSLSQAVNGNPTITVLPDAGTADPRMERVVAWSQGSAVYFVRTTGLFTDSEALDLATTISLAEEARK